MSLSRQDLADALGVSTMQVWRLAKRGMPTDSIRAAREWRAANLDPSQSREFRQDAHYRPRQVKRPAPSPVAVEAATADALTIELVARLADRAAGDFDGFSDDLRAALRAVPLRARDRVCLPRDVFERLVAPALEALDLQCDPATAAAQSDADADAMGAFLFALGAGDLEVCDRALIARTAAGQAVLAAVIPVGPSA